jgi:SAM-dependent methyltransferase
MTALADRYQERYYQSSDHPYHIYERKIGNLVSSDMTVLDAGCGYTAPVLVKYRGRARRLIGVDLVNFKPDQSTPGVELMRSDLNRIALPSTSVDLVISRSVMEHLEDPASVYREIHRLLRPGGHFLFLTPNFGDYVSLISYLTPNKLHGWIVEKTEGRAPEDTFPTFYKSNTRGAVAGLAKAEGFELVSLDYLGQYPNMLKFNAAAFLAGTLYEKIISRVDALKFLRGWLLVDLVKKKAAGSDCDQIPRQLQRTSEDAELRVAKARR